MSMWMLLAANAYGITVIPLYDTLGPQSTRFILGETQMKTVVSDGDCLVKLLDALQQQHTADSSSATSQQREIAMECIVTVDDIPEDQKERAAALNLRLLSWNDLLELVRIVRNTFDSGEMD